MHIACINPQGNFDPADSHWTAHPDFGGQLVYVKQLALAMESLGHRVDIITRQIIDPKWPEFADRIDGYPDHPNIRVLRFPCGPPYFLPKEELWPYLRGWVGHIIQWYRSENSQPDVCMGHYADGGLCSALLQEQMGIPFTFTAHSLGAWKLDRLLETESGCAPGQTVGAGVLMPLETRYSFGARIPAEQSSMARAGVIIASTAEERDQQYRHPAYREIAGADGEQRISVVPPGVDHAIFDLNTRSPSEEEVRQAIHVALDRDIAPERRNLPAVIAWSRLDPKKNYLGLIQAFARSPVLRSRANLILITRGLEDPLHHPDAASANEQQVLLPMIDETDRYDLWGAVSAFHLAGQDAAAALYRWGTETGAVFCLPAEHEPFGLSLIEAMATGLPVVATSHGGPQETTDGGWAGLLADPHDPEEIAEQLLRLIADPEAWNRYAARGRARAIQLYSWEQTAAGYLRLVDEVLRRERGGDLSFPLPAFIASDDHPQLPTLGNWQLGTTVH